MIRAVLIVVAFLVTGLPEHWKESQWERDIKKIADMGYEFVHLAEFAWFKMEPGEGKYNFSWLDRVVNLCVKYRLKVLLCTPSATTPTWMRVNYPETFIKDSHYIRAENGTRGLGSVVNLNYRRFVTKIVAEMAKRYGKNKNVIGWQIDNEPGALPDYSSSSQVAIRTWLRLLGYTLPTSLSLLLLHQCHSSALPGQWSPFVAHPLASAIRSLSCFFNNLTM